MMRAVEASAFTLLTAALVAAVATQAHPESDAALLHPDVEAAWHLPEEVVPGQQWEGLLRLREGHDIRNASYQICNAGKSATCFAPPTPAAFLEDGRTLRFHTSEYLANGRPVDWEAGWLVGIRWCLAEAGAQDCTWVPAQDGDTIASHYLTFRIPGGHGDRGAPGIAGAGVAAALAAAAIVRRR